VKNLIETIVSEVMNVLMKKGFNVNETGKGIVAEQSKGMSGCAGEQERGSRGGGGKGKGHCGGQGGGSGRGAGGGCGK
jgi:hypothetical protein